MQTLFECTVRYSKPLEGTDKMKRVSEVYLFDALTYTEAEKRAYEKLPEIISGDFIVTGIRKAKYAEIIPNEEGGYWFKVKASFIMIDENSGKEKRVSQMVLTLAEDIKDAVDRTAAAMNDADLPDFMVKSVNESNILDFFPFSERQPEDEIPAERETGRRPATAEELAAAKAAKE